MTFIRKTRTALRLAVGLGKKSPSLLRQYRFPVAADRRLKSISNRPMSSTDYDDLVRYLGTSWVTYRNSAGSGASYPGLPSWSGADCDALEGFSRTMPLFGAWCASGRPHELNLLNGHALDLPREFKRGILAGTDVGADTYWGDMPGKSNQRIVEAADVALALWLFRDTVWKSLDESERMRVVHWLSLVNGRPGLDNNWHLFFVMIDRVLTSLGYSGRIGGVHEHFTRVKDFHLGDGWFSDGPAGGVDYYSAWGFHSTLTWIDRIDPDWDPQFIRPTLARFLKSYRYLLGPNGFPILGRSIPYRLAAPAPLIAGLDQCPGVVSPGEARRALNVIWQHFLSRGALRRGTVTQGYYGPDPRVVDPYSGPASSLWSLRSLVMAYALPPDHLLWQAMEEPLPVEVEDFVIEIEGPRWRVTGDRASGAIVVEVLDNEHGAAPQLEPFTRIQVLHSLAFGEPPRPKNLNAKYGRRFYRSDTPFCTLDRE
jgi:hypothetical protein